MINIIEVIKLLRPVHWIKNLTIFAALVFSYHLYDKGMFLIAFWAFACFNLAASATYVLNDIMDVKRDRLHPIKKNRPLAKGSIPLWLAFIIFPTLVAVSIIGAVALSDLFALILVSYVLLQVAYSLYLKNIHILDILIIATGFVIRIYAGAVVVNAHLSVWFLLCVISAALFLASGKRRAEMRSVPSSETRASLSKYSKELLNSYVTMFGNAAWMSWALFTFFESPQEVSTPIWLFLAELSKTTTINKFLMATIPVTIFGIMRYENLIFEGRSEAPERLLLTDKALVASVIIWIVMVITILYGGVANF